MLGSAVTTSASSPSACSRGRTASCRRLSAALGACAMNRREELFERANRRGGTEAFGPVPFLVRATGQLDNRPLQFRIVGRECQGGAGTLERRVPIAAATFDV